MKEITFDSMSAIQGGRELSDACIKSLIAEGLSYAALFACSGPFAIGIAALAIGGLITSAVSLGINCS